VIVLASGTTVTMSTATRTWQDYAAYDTSRGSTATSSRQRMRYVGKFVTGNSNNGLSTTPGNLLEFEIAPGNRLEFS